MAEYFLPLHVHFCRRGDDLVFLDLKQDDYTLINGPTAAVLKALVPSGRLDEARPEAADALQELLTGGLLVTDPSHGKSIRPTQAEVALEPLIDPESEPRVRLRISHFYSFIAACTTAAARLRWQRIEHTVKAVERRKARHGTEGSFDMDAARDLTAVFHTLRGLFPRNYLCLFDSLALIEFLARYRIFPTWVFAVRLEPWGAHCWVQQGQFIYNEDVETAAGFTPIMTI